MSYAPRCERCECMPLWQTLARLNIMIQCYAQVRCLTIDWVTSPSNALNIAIATLQRVSDTVFDEDVMMIMLQSLLPNSLHFSSEFSIFVYNMCLHLAGSKVEQ